MNGDFEGALRYFMGAVKFYEENDPGNLNLGFGYGNISTTFADLKKIDNAVVYSKKAIDFAEKNNSKNLLMSSSIAHGNNLLKLKSMK
jgi:16S rRNA G1207 methylase RsmC